MYIHTHTHICIYTYTYIYIHIHIHIYIYFGLFIFIFIFCKDYFKKHKNVIVHSPKSVTGPDLTEKNNNMQCVQQDEKVDRLMSSMSLLKPKFYSRLNWLIISWTAKNICSFSRFCRFRSPYNNVLISI